MGAQSLQGTPWAMLWPQTFVLEQSAVATLEPNSPAPQMAGPSVAIVSGVTGQSVVSLSQGALEGSVEHLHGL